PYLHEDSIVCTLQNGIPEELVASIVGRERTLGGAVGFGATFTKPGVSSLTTELAVMKKYAFEIGELDGSITERLKVIKAILDSVGYRSEEHTSELQSRFDLVCRLLLEKKNKNKRAK